jgi:hypothetical protein
MKPYNLRGTQIFISVIIQHEKTKYMKVFYGSIFLMIALFYSSCAVVESIFKAGVWVGILVVVGIIGLIVWILSRFTKKS